MTALRGWTGVRGRVIRSFGVKERLERFHAIELVFAAGNGFASAVLTRKMQSGRRGQRLVAAAVLFEGFGDTCNLQRAGRLS